MLHIYTYIYIGSDDDDDENNVATVVVGYFVCPLKI